MAIQNWTDIVVTSLQNLWLGFVHFIPNLIGALIVFAIGLILAAALSTLVERFFDAVKLDPLLARAGLAPYLERGGLRLRGAYFLGRLIYWFIVIGFLLAASDILQLAALSEFLQSVLSYVPNVIAAILILLASVFVAGFLRKVVVASAKGARLYASQLFLGSLTWWAVFVFGLLAALVQLNIAAAIIQSIVIGIIAMFALAGGLAFGLAGKEYAAELIGKFRNYMKAE